MPLALEDPLFLARFPQLPQAREAVRAGGYTLGDLLADPVYERARRRAVQRVMGALERDGIVDAQPAGRIEADLELLSYPLARAIVVGIGDDYLTNRYATAEAKLFDARLNAEDEATVWEVATTLGLPLEHHPEAFAQVPFLDFLRNAPGRDASWKLVNQPLVRGQVLLTKERAVRLAQEALRERLIEELDELERPGRALQKVFERDLNQIRLTVASIKERFLDDKGGPLRPEAFPPCIQAIWKGIQGHVNVPHMGRFAIVSFLHTLGMSSQQILDFFASVPDFDVSKSRYQIEHITGQIGSTQYSPPGCGTMQTYGLCPLEQRDDICLNLIHHPLSYYRKKLRRLPRTPTPAAPAATGVTNGGPAAPAA